MMLCDETKNYDDVCVSFQEQMAQFLCYRKPQKNVAPLIFDISEGKQQIRVLRFFSIFTIQDAN